MTVDLPDTIVKQVVALKERIATFDKAFSNKNKIAYALTSVGLVAGLLAIVNPNKFTIDQITIKKDSDQRIYKVIDGVYEREASFNPSGFAAKTRIVGQIPGDSMLIEAMLGTSLVTLGIGYLVHRDGTKQLLLLKQQKYELHKLVAISTNSVIASHLQVQQFNLATEVQTRVNDTKNVYDIINQPMLSEEQILKIREEQKRNEELLQLDHERKVAMLRAETSKLQQSIKPKEIKKTDLPAIPGINWWNFEWFTTKSYELIPHIRIIGATGSGKTVLADYLLDLLPGDDVKVLTIKRKPHQWLGRKVIGVPEDYEALQIEFDKLEAERVERLRDVAEGREPSIVNIAIDEARAIVNKVEKASPIIKDVLTISREAKQRLILLAQGRGVKIWGLEGEGDLQQCMVTLYIGSFAREECQTYLNKSKHISDDSKSKVMQELEKAGSRALFVESEFGVFPGIVPEING